MRSTRYGGVVQGRLQNMGQFYRAQHFVLPAHIFTPLVIGLLALRLGVFERPEEHKKLIVTALAFGIVSWGIHTWLPPIRLLPAAAPVFAYAAIGLGSGVLRGSWLAFAYIGGILFLIASSRVWLHRLAPFAITGRMALTNYMLQAIILDLTFSNYALGAQIRAVYAPLAALALFALEVILCRWWQSASVWPTRVAQAHRH